MLKKISNLALLLAFTASLHAAPIDKHTALSRAQSFVLEKGFDLELRESQQARTRAGMENEAPCYYIFNSADGEGFVIVAGDDLLYPILGYSDKGSIDLDNIPDGLASLLGHYEEVTLDLRAQEQAGQIATTTDNPRRAMTLTKNPIKPFLFNNYGHYGPYNNQNPYYNSKKHSSCACSTVAVAEVMCYYKYPAVIPKAAGYITETLGLELSDLPAYEIDWDNILPNYADVEYSQVEMDEIAHFMFHLGQYMHTDFQEDSASPTKDIYTTLKNFGYRSTEARSFSLYLMPDLEDIFYDNLSKGMPVIVSGCNIRIGGARHVFILDGYDQDARYHIDWGWDGCCQGYYSFTNISPYDNISSYAYFKDLWCIFNIEPKQNSTAVEEENPHVCLDLTALSLSNGKVVTSRRNYSGVPGIYVEALGLVDETNRIVKILGEDSIYLKNNSEVSTRTWAIDNLGDVKNGEYYIYAISRLSNGDGLWHFDKVRSTVKNGLVKASIENGSASLTLLPPVQYNSLELYDATTCYKGAARKFKLNLTNNTMDMVNRMLYVYEDSITPMHFANINIPARCNMDYDIIYIPQETGTHQLLVCTDTLRSNILFQKTINVKNSVKYSLNLDSIIIDNYNSTQKNLYGNELRIRVKITNNGTYDYNDYFRFLVKKSWGNDRNTWYNTKKPLLHLPAGESMWLDFETKDMAYYQKFTLYVYYKTNSSNDPNVFTTHLYSRDFVPRPAIRMWKEDGKMYAKEPTTKKLVVPSDVIALDLTTPNIDLPSSIVPNGNPNALYYVPKSYDELSSYNQIVNGSAESITLVDSIPCYVPIDFTAEHAEYTRTFEKGFMGKINENNWTTIVLPFDVDKVYNTVDHTKVKWNKPGEDDGQFWLREFYGEDGFYTYFTDAEEMRANEPYIITVPGATFGEEACLVGKPLVFSGDDTRFPSSKVVADGRSFDFQGSYYKTSTYGNNIYKLDEENRGNYFAYVSGEGVVYPFRAYFTSMVKPQSGSRLHVASYIKPSTNIATGIHDIVETTENGSAVRMTLPGVYTITGRMVSTTSDASAREILNTLPKGVYIINGKKYVK